MKTEHKTKNDYFLDMLVEVLAWGLQPAFITGDRGYSSASNLKTVRHHRRGFLFAVENNRRVSTEKGTWVQVQPLDIPDDGLKVWLRDFGEVKLFRTRLKNQRHHYVVFLPDAEAYETFSQTEFQKRHDPHWHIEQYHRLIKQVCQIESFQVRRKVPILNHIFAALCSYVHLQQMQIHEIIINAYQWQRDLYKEVVAGFVSAFIYRERLSQPTISTCCQCVSPKSFYL